MLVCASCLAVASCQSSPALTDPCDVLVRQEPKPATNSYIVANDKPFAQSVAINRGRVKRYGCAGK